MAMTQEEMKAFEVQLVAEDRAKKFARPFDMARAMARSCAAIALTQTEVPDETFYLGDFSGYFAPQHEAAAEILREALVNIGSVQKDTQIFVPAGKESEDKISVDIQVSLDHIPLQQLLQAIQEIQTERAKQQRQ
jgi:hypothetical protein